MQVDKAQRRLETRGAIVVGGATGIGAATVRRLRQEGAAVLVAGLSTDPLSQVAAETGALPVVCDVTDEAQVRNLAQLAAQRLQSIDILVNAAGIVIADDAASIEDRHWAKTMDVNLTGTMRVCRALIPAMARRGAGAIVNIASVAAFNATSGSASYAASKAGVIALTRSIANRYGEQGIRANCICPGWVRTPMSTQEMAERAQAAGTTLDHEFAQVAARNALQRVAEPDEIASVVVFLASSDASFMTGATLIVDGGARTPAAAKA